MQPIDMHELKQRGPRDTTEALRIEMCDKVNALGIGAQGLGGMTTVLDVKLETRPTHAASLPVALIPNMVGVVGSSPIAPTKQTTPQSLSGCGVLRLADSIGACGPSSPRPFVRN